MFTLVQYRILLSLVLFLGLNGVFSAQAFQNKLPSIQSYLKSDFDLQSQNWAISQDYHNQFLYFANSDGLMVFNGVAMQKYTLEENYPFRSVHAHVDGRVFTGSFEEFGFWQYNKSGALEYTSLAALAQPEKNDEIWKIYARGDTVYFQSFTSIYQYHNNKVEKIKAPYTMLFMHLLGDRFVVQIIDNGLFWFQNGEFLLIENSRLFSDKKIHAIIPFGRDKWLICTDKEGLYVFDGKDFRFFASEASTFLKTFTCNTAVQLSDSAFAFGSILNGLIITDRDGNIQQGYNTNNGLNNNTVLSLFVDIDQGLWAGLDEGVNHVDILSPFTYYTTRNGTLGTIYAMLKKDQHLYIGTNHGLFRSTIVKKGHIYSFENLQFIQGSQGQVWSLYEFDGEIFCGHNEGIFLLSGDRLQRISSVTGGWAFIPFEDFILVGTYTGIVVLEKSRTGKWQFRNRIDGFSEPTRYLETDYLGYLWASHHQKGLFKIELSDDFYQAINVEHISEIDGRSFNIKVFKINNRVVFSMMKSIYTWDFVRNEIVEFDAINEGLGDYKGVNQINYAQKSQYWFIGEEKMALFDVSMDFSVEKLLEIPLHTIILPQRHIQMVSLDEDVILKPNHQHFDAIHLPVAKQTTSAHRLAIEKMLFYSLRDTLIWYARKPDRVLPAKINNLTVYFSDPSDFSLYPKNYFYRIAQLDQAWQSTTRNQFVYLDLKHGDYTLEITRDPNEAGIMVSFSVAKPWRISNMAYIIYAIVLLAIIWGVVEFFRFEISRQKELVALEIRQNRLEKELDYKSYELMLIMRHLMLKDDILNELQKQIDVIKVKSSKYPVKYLNQMERIISQGLGTQNIEWENAMKSLKLTQQGFFKALKENYPDLTSNDLRLCSYLKLNFNSKEIARLLNISPRSVEISRHRLRKKLKLNSEQNLYDFLMEIDNSITD